MSDNAKSDNSIFVTLDRRPRFGRTVLAVALMSAAGVFAADRAAAQTLQPSWVHRGAKMMFNIGATTATAATNGTLNAVSTSVLPPSCAANPTVVAVNLALKSFKDPNNNTVQEQVDCTQTFYQTTVTVTGVFSYNETYYSFQTVPLGSTTPASPANGHAIYFPAGGSSASLMFEPD